MAWHIGVDVGGTFTDFCAVDAKTGRIRLHKRASTPRNPATAIVEGLLELARNNAILMDEIARVSHGTTVATNALIERRGGKVALVTTAGFRDLIEIGRQTRPHMYSLQMDHPAPLVPRERRYEIAERVAADGSVFRPLDEAYLGELIERLRQDKVDACAVCFLFSYLNPEHERRVKRALEAALPGLHVSASSEVQPEFREVERFMTAVLNAYLQPVMDEYLRSLAAGLGEFAPKAPIGIYQSSGGLMSIERARTFPVRTALSGPAAGVIGALHCAAASERSHVITFDMGGTSTDVCLLRDGREPIAFEREVASFPIRLPMVDVHTVGAGGGSIGWFDRDGLLKVGPRSAGADPGPACYGRGGMEPTVTDANLVLGRLSAHGLAGGSLALDPARARAAILPVAARLSMSPEDAALGMLGIVAANMVRAIRAVSVERGYDPREYTLMPFGGAGPLHAVEVARNLSIREILVPQAPGILCAQGLLVSPLKEDFVRTVRLPVAQGALVELRAVLSELRSRALAWLMEEGVKDQERRLRATLDMRYVGQNFELSVQLPVADGTAKGWADSADALNALFFEAHNQQYGYFSDRDPVEVVNVRVTGLGRLLNISLSGGDAPALERGAVRRPVWFDEGGPIDVPVLERNALEVGYKVAGPAVIEQFDSTTLLFPGTRARVERTGNLFIAVEP